MMKKNHRQKKLILYSPDMLTYIYRLKRQKMKFN